MDAEYWEDTFEETKTLEPEIVFVETLIDPTMDSQLEDVQDPLSINVEDYAKSLVNFKEKKKTSLKEDQESRRYANYPEKWEINVKRNARLKRGEYVRMVIGDTKMGRPCTCRLHCADKIDEKEREELNKVFWETFTWQQRKQYIALSIKEYLKQRTRLRQSKSSRRHMSYTYFLLLKGEYITVCKSMFLSTFAVSTKFVQDVIDKKRMSRDRFISPNQRDKHTPKIKKKNNVKNRVREH